MLTCTAKRRQLQLSAFRSAQPMRKTEGSATDQQNTEDEGRNQVAQR